MCRQIAELLSSRLELEPNIGLRAMLASSLGRIAGKMDPVEASQVCDKVIDILLRPRSEEPQQLDSIILVVALLLAKLDPQTASRRARVLCMEMFRDRSTPSITPRQVFGIQPAPMYADSELLKAVLTDNSREQLSRRIAHIAKSAGPGYEGALVTAARRLRRALPLPPHQPRTRRPAQNADMLRRRPPRRPRPPRQPLRPPLRQPLGLRPLRDRAEAQPRLHHPAAPAGARSLNRYAETGDLESLPRSMKACRAISSPD